MKTTVALRASAERDLRHIADYSQANHGIRVMHAYIADLQSALNRLADFPELGAVRSDLDKMPRCLACREHLIFYDYANAHVSVLRILHKAMEVGRWL